MYSKDNLDEIVDILDEGGILLYPTDTIWGLGCDAMNPEAIAKIYAIKQRPSDKPLTILVDSIEMLRVYVPDIHPKIETLLAYHERPLTIIYSNIKKLPEGLMSKDGSVAIRVVKDAFCQALIQKFGRPIVSTSANVSNEPFPVNFGQISSDIISRSDYVVKHRQDEKSPGEPSVMIRLSPRSELIFVRN